MGTHSHEAEVWEEIAAGGWDIGHDVIVKPIGNAVFPWAGVLLYHRHRDGSVCGGFVQFDVPGADRSRPLWKIESWDPLTLSPSIQDKTCSEGLHGYIRQDRWCPC